MLAKIYQTLKNTCVFFPTQLQPYLFVKETASFDHYFCDHRWLFISGWFLWFLLLPLQADTKVTIGGILCENPQNSAHGYFNTTWGQFKLQHSLLLQLWGFTWLHYLRLTSNTFLLDPDVFLIPKTKDFFGLLGAQKQLQPHATSKSTSTLFLLGVVGGWDAPIFLMDPTVAYFRMLFFSNPLHVFCCTRDM